MTISPSASPPPRHPRIQLRNLTFQLPLLGHEPRSRLLQIRNLIRGRGFCSSFDLLLGPEKRPSARNLQDIRKKGL